MSYIHKPGECMKYMNVEMHPRLLEAWYCADVRREVTAAGAHVLATNNLCHEALVMWSRTVLPHLINNGEQVHLTPTTQSCDHALCVLDADVTSAQVSAHTLAAHVSEIKEMVGCALTLVIFLPKDFYKPSGRRTNNSRQKMTEIDLDMAITDLLVSSECDAEVVHSASELALLIVQFTKAIAEAPHKLAKRALDDEATFYMKGDSRNCVGLISNSSPSSKANKCAMRKLWQQMVAILPMSSLPVARALCDQYDSPRALFEALQSPDGVDVIADIGVSRAAVPGTVPRRIGPEFARKLQILFTAENGNTLLD